MKNDLKIIGTGLSGLVGSRIVELNSDIQFTDLSLDTGFDILKSDTLKPVFEKFTGDVVLHLAAFTDTNAAWSQKGNKNGLCYQLNVVGTQNIVDLCRQYDKHLIYISTDFVFDGQKKGSYLETDTPHPLEWYGQTKYEAEKIAATINSSIIRFAFPYRANFPAKMDIVRKIIAKLSASEVVTMFTDQLTTPTFVDDIALGLRKIIDQKPLGIYHLVGSSSQSPYDMAKLIAATFGYDGNLVNPSSLVDYLKTPDARPYAPNLSLSNQKFVSEFNFPPKTLPQGLEELKKQL
jgi:dTDP-4-dehydrorhamnose reductase